MGWHDATHGARCAERLAPPRRSPCWLPTRNGARPTGSLEKLHSGECAAILLAEAVHADLVLLDERAGRKVAMERGQTVAGLVGVLDLAAARGLMDFHATLRDLLATRFRLSPELVKHFLSQRS